MLGVPLSALGQHQANRLAAYFASSAVTAVISSPVQRAQETAAPIAAALTLDIQTDAGFDEIDFGDWTGTTFANLETDHAWSAWNRLRSLAAPPGGEPMHHAQSRALAALSRCRAAYPDQQIVLVSHADIIRALLAPALGLSLDRLYRLSIDPGTISTLVLFDEDLRIERINAAA